jgi:hypothetical protein
MPPEPRAPGERTLFLVGVCAVVVLAFSLRVSGLAPPSLFLDDVWVALFVREASFRELLTLRPPHPAGFMAVQALALRLFPGAELAVQIVPLTASLALIPLGAWLVRRTTGSACGGILAAVLLALNPTLSAYSVRAKPYATDALTSLLLVAVTLACLTKTSTGRLRVLALLASLAIPFSYPAALVGAVGFAVAFTTAAVTGRERRPLLWIAGAFVAAEAALGFLFVFGQSNDVMKSFWQPGFVPLGRASDALLFIASRSALLSLSSFPENWTALGILVPLGFALLLGRRATRPAAALVAALYTSLFAAAALRLYPMDGRTVTFAFPLVALLAAWTVSSVARGVHAPLLREGLPAFLAAAVALTSSTPVSYPPFEDARVVRTLAREARPEDAVLVYPHANWTAAYYAGWPVRIVRNDDYGTRFEARLLRKDSFTLPGIPGYERRPELLDPALRIVLSANPQRVLYLATHLEVDCCAAHNRVRHSFQALGYSSERLAVANGAELIRFTRPPDQKPSGSPVLPTDRGSRSGPGASGPPGRGRPDPRSGSASRPGRSQGRDG